MMPSVVRTHARNASCQPLFTGPRAPLAWAASLACFQETPVGVEPTSNCFAGSCRAVWLQRQVVQVSSPGIEPGLRPSQGRVRIRHTPRTSCFRHSTPPRNRTSSGSFEDCRASSTLAGQQSKCPDLDSNQDHDLRRVACDPLHHQDKLFNQSRRLDSHQHQPVYKTGASLFGHVGNKQEREESNPVKRFWRPLALPGARSCKAGPSCPSLDRLASADAYSKLTFQYASLTNFDQLSIRTLCAA